MSLVVSSVLLLVVGCGQDQQKIQELETKNASLTTEKEALSAELASEKSSHEKAKADLAAKVEELASSTDTIADLTKQLETAKADAAAASEQLEKAVERATDAEKALANLQATHDKAVADAKAEADGLKAEIEALKKQVADLTKALGEGEPEESETPEP